MVMVRESDAICIKFHKKSTGNYMPPQLPHIQRDIVHFSCCIGHFQ